MRRVQRSARGLRQKGPSHGEPFLRIRFPFEGGRKDKGAGCVQGGGCIGSIFGGTLGIVGDLLEEGMVARISGYRNSSGKNLK